MGGLIEHVKLTNVVLMLGQRWQSLCQHCVHVSCLWVAPSEHVEYTNVVLMPGLASYRRRTNFKTILGDRFLFELGTLSIAVECSIRFTRKYQRFLT